MNSLEEDDDGEGAEEEQLETNVDSSEENDDSAEESSCWVVEGEADGKWSYSNRHRSRILRARASSSRSSYGGGEPDASSN